MSFYNLIMKLFALMAQFSIIKCLNLIIGFNKMKNAEYMGLQKFLLHK